MAKSSIPPLYRYVGRVIHVMRKERGMRQSELAALTGLRQPNLSRIETGLVVPRKSTLNKIAEALDVDVRELLSEAKAREVQSKWDATLSPKNAGLIFSGKLLPVVLYGADGTFGVVLDETGQPTGHAELTLQLAPIPGRVFATRVIDDSMETTHDDPRDGGFKPGEIVVFADQPEVRSGDYAFIQLKGETHFRRVSMAGGSDRIGLKALNQKYAERFVKKGEVQAMWRLVRRIQAF